MGFVLNIPSKYFILNLLELVIRFQKVVSNFLQRAILMSGFCKIKFIQIINIGFEGLDSSENSVRNVFNI